VFRKITAKHLHFKERRQRSL